MIYNDRIGAADIAKGISLIIIITLYDFYPGLLQSWFSSEALPATINVITGFSFTAFFYLSGVTIPFFITKKINQGNSVYEVIRMIFARTLILITVGVLLANIPRVNPEFTGVSQPLWALMLIVAIFLTWNRYPDRENNFFTVSGLRILGLAIIVFLVFRFRSGSYENNGSFIPGCWELPGLLGWGFLVSSLVWLALRNSIAGTLIILFFFLSLNVINALGLNDYLDPARRYFGVLIDGFIPSIVLCGHLTGVVLKRYPPAEYKKPALLIAGGGIIFVTAGILTIRSFPLTGSFNNPAWAIAGAGTASLIFIILYMIFDLRRYRWRPVLIESAGGSFFTVYIIYFLISSMISLSGLNLLIYKTSSLLLIKTGGSVIFSFVILLTGNFLLRTGIRLKF
jgi:hypothetical protein